MYKRYGSNFFFSVKAEMSYFSKKKVFNQWRPGGGAILALNAHNDWKKSTPSDQTQKGRHWLWDAFNGAPDQKNRKRAPFFI